MSIYCKGCAFANSGCKAPEHIKKSCTYYDNVKQQIKSDTQINEENKKYND